MIGSVILTGGFLPLALADPTPPLTESASIDAAYGYLQRQMDQCHISVSIYTEPACNMFYPSGFMGNHSAIELTSPDPCAAHSGATGVTIRYKQSRSAPTEWAGVYFLYPDTNPGNLPWGWDQGRNIGSAEALSFQARSDAPTAAEIILGGVKCDRAPLSDAGKRDGVPPETPCHADSFGPVSKQIPITTDWRRHVIGLRGHDLRSVVGPFALVMQTTRIPRTQTIQLDDIELLTGPMRLEEPRFVQSYTLLEYPARGPDNIAHTYDQALVLLAFLARANPDDLRRAALIADAMVLAQENDRAFSDGRLRNAYASGELLVASGNGKGTARLPGRWVPAVNSYQEDYYAAGTDTGNIAWAALALVQAHRVLGEGDAGGHRKYLSAAVRMAEWVMRQKDLERPPSPGFPAGVEGFESDGAEWAAGQTSKRYRSTEHHIDLAVLFEHLALAFGTASPQGDKWRSHATEARAFVDQMRSPTAHLWTGTTNDSTVINRDVIPLDIQTWSVMGLGGRMYSGALDWALRKCNVGAERDAFDYKCAPGYNAWWEGTAQVALALHTVGRGAEAERVLARLRREQITDPKHPAYGALPASAGVVDTGFGWQYHPQPHIGATAWYLFAALKRNPYDVAGARAKGAAE